MKVKNILESKKRRGEILQISGDGKLSDAVNVMVENDTGSVAIYEDSHFVGMLTFREILIAVKEHGFTAAADVSCGTLVERGGACATPEDSVDQIRNLMTTKHIRYLPVITDGKLTDIISFYDVARSMAKAIDFENRMLKEYIGDWPADRE